MARSALPTETVEVGDPIHPLDGLRLPLLDIATNRHLGRVCVVQLHPGRERPIPLAAAARGEIVRPRSRGRLSLGAITALLAGGASLPEVPREDVPAPLSPASGAEPPAAAPPRPSPLSPPTGAPGRHHRGPAGPAASRPGPASDGAARPAPPRPGGAA